MAACDEPWDASAASFVAEPGFVGFEQGEDVLAAEGVRVWVCRRVGSGVAGAVGAAGEVATFDAAAQPEGECGVEVFGDVPVGELLAAEFLGFDGEVGFRFRGERLGFGVGLPYGAPDVVGGGGVVCGGGLAGARGLSRVYGSSFGMGLCESCLLYTSDAADD